ncbi:alpha/beta hydrolase [Psychrobacillus sp. NEAU-3TGS]|uniref:alpha/beta fold hydrolase n=1 Tax=Psychrobacillus sp. NEAU-3TGS TaxID=2995412 RepID=UPI00249666DF|nr:alpha/beta hydrolase [Psychrobacillus sp. NEAU-3TGS]MDI2588818.1 alpha/beta hydrolase [Psychrobacillus sp. NEAU-3TGS]
MSEDRTVVYYEQRGCGRSGKPTDDNAYSMNELVDDFRKIIEWTGSEKIDLLGYSFRGELALEFASNFLYLINKIILSSPSMINLKTQYMIQIAGFQSIADMTLVNRIEEILKKNTSIEHKYKQVWEIVDQETIDRLLFVDPEVASKYRELVIESNLHNLHNTGRMLTVLQENSVTPPLYERLNNIHHKTLIITGVYDRSTGIPISNLIHRNLSNSEWILFNNSAHFPELEETENFVSSVLGFLKA